MPYDGPTKKRKKIQHTYICTHTYIHTLTRSHYVQPLEPRPEPRKELPSRADMEKLKEKYGRKPGGPMSWIKRLIKLGFALATMQPVAVAIFINVSRFLTECSGICLCELVLVLDGTHTELAKVRNGQPKRLQSRVCAGYVTDSTRTCSICLRKEPCKSRYLRAA